MKPFIILAALASIVAFTASSCFQQPSKGDQEAQTTALCNACLKAAPDVNDLEIKLPEEDNGKAMPLALGELAEYYTTTVQISRDLNQWILGTLSMLDEILTSPPTQSNDNTCVWGPFIPNGLSPVEMRFSMTKQSETDYDYLWDERPKYTSDDFTPIWGGHIIPATDSARRGIGDLYIDYTALQDLDPTWDVSGRIDVTYDTYTDGRKIDIAFDQFVTEDASIPVDATYHYHNHADNSGEFSFVYDADFPINGIPGDILETADQETLWYGTGEGYSTMTISGGDLTGSDFMGFTADRIEGKECWDEFFGRTFYRLQLFFLDHDPMDLEDTEGVESDCATF